MKGHRKYIAFLPYCSPLDTYADMMHRIIRKHYATIDYAELKKGRVPFSQVRAIYLNWLESSMDDQDRKLLRKAAFTGVKIYWVFHNKLPHEQVLDETIVWENLKLLIHLSDKIIIHSRESRSLIQAYCPRVNTDKIHYLPHIHYIGKYYGYCRDIRKQMGMGENDLMFALYGYLKPYKNIEILIQAMKKLSGERCKLLVAGQAWNKEYIEELENLAAETNNITIVSNFISNLQMGAFLKAADVLVLPYSLASGLNSGAMIMAFSYQRTVIISDIAMTYDFPRELFYPYQYATAEEHQERLTEQLEAALNQGRQQNLAKGKQLHDIVRQSCSPEVVEEMLVKLLRE